MIGRVLSAASEPTQRLGAWTARIAIAGYRGRLQEAASFADEMVRTAPPPFNLFTPQAVAAMALERGQTAKALAIAEEVATKLRDQPPGLTALGFLAVTQARAGQLNQAAQTLQEVQKIAASRPNPTVRRNAERAAGEIALARGDVAQAIALLTKTSAALRPRALGNGFGPGPGQHVSVWYALGQAHLAAGNLPAAADAFRKIVESGVARVGAPMLFVRSYYFLGQIAERQGDHAKAREHYRRFYDYWKDGDIDRDRIAEVRKKLG